MNKLDVMVLALSYNAPINQKKAILAVAIVRQKTGKEYITTQDFYKIWNCTSVKSAQSCLYLARHELRVLKPQRAGNMMRYTLTNKGVKELYSLLSCTPNQSETPA